MLTVNFEVSVQCVANQEKPLFNIDIEFPPKVISLSKWKLAQTRDKWDQICYDVSLNTLHSTPFEKIDL